MPFNTTTVSVTSANGNQWVLDRPLTYRGQRDRFVIPAGFRTDFATIPRLLTWLVGRTGQHTLAVVLHDWLVTTGVDSGAVSHRDADGLLRRVLRETGTPFVRRWLMWAGVRYGALFGGRRDDWIRDAALVALITVLAAPVVAPPVSLCGAGWLLYKIAEEIAWFLAAMFK